MKRPMAIAAAVALMLIASPTVADEEPAYTVDLENGVVYLRHDFGVLDHPGNGMDEQVDCTAADAVINVVAGASQYCTTGSHDTAVYFITIGFDINQPGVTGVLTHVVTSVAGEVRFQCQWTSGAWNGCQIISATWPGPNADFCHDLWGHAETAPTGPELLGYAPECPWGDAPVVGGVLTANSAASGAGSAEGDWVGYVIHA